MYLLLRVLANPWAPSVLPGLEPLLISSGLPFAFVLKPPHPTYYHSTGGRPQ